MRWRVELTAQAEREIRQGLTAGLFQQDDVTVLKKWVDEVEKFGPARLSRSKYWNDHALQREWRGFRSSSFSFRGRIIYRVLDEKVVIEVVRVTANHDYSY